MPVTHVVATPVVAAQPRDDDPRWIQLESARQLRRINLAAQISRCHRRQDHRHRDRGAARGHRKPTRSRTSTWLCHLASFSSHLSAWSASCQTDLDISVVVHQSTSIPTGLTELAAEHEADLVVVGSSSSGLLGRVALGSVTDRLVHTAAVPVAIAPRGYPTESRSGRRLTAAYGGQADVGRPHRRPAAELAKQWSVRLRIVSFTVRPMTMFSGSIEPSAEDLVVEQWSRRTIDEIAKQLNDVRASIAIPDVEVVIGTGHDWREAVEMSPGKTATCCCWDQGAAGPTAQVFLGSAAVENPAARPCPRDDRSETTKCRHRHDGFVALDYPARSLIARAPSGEQLIGVLTWSINFCCGLRKTLGSRSSWPTIRWPVRRCNGSSRGQA